MKSVSKTFDPVRMSDLAALLDSRILLGSLPQSRSAALNDVLRRATPRALLELIRGRRGPRRAYVMQALRRVRGRRALRNQQQLAALMSAQDGLLPGIGHYGFFHTEHGIGQGARRLAQAMSAAGVPGSRHSLVPSALESKIQFPAAGELTSPYDTILLHFNGDTFLDLFDRFPLAALFRPRRIGYWAWELPVLPPQWVPALAKLHEVWVPSRFVAETVASATSKPVRLVPHAVPVEDLDQAGAREELRLPRDAFLFLTVFDSNSYMRRKNVLGVIRAFIDAFPAAGASAPMLVVKCHGRGNRGAEFREMVGLMRDSDRLILIDRVFSPHEMLLIQAACDCFVSLHRAEGFGLNIAECMGKGKIVIATDFSGSTDFARPSNALLVPYRMAEVGRGSYVHGGGQWWAEPDHDAAVEAMRRAAAYGADVQALAACARADIERDYSLDAIGRIARAAWEETLAPFAG
jgi:glycosyltransferase involved in cell wall biosynthesis